ncbi:arylamine N-acetyltransferase family protein [Saccharopolyspora elongata]|uniref:Arylamine N-acetyltransferase n=1 Tax=Saccharopolyspora elongata TaxID=2530387 RepID=A0A4R4YSY0_9PSEU|nr:arylamine N-acetyltransferase [Saccharopolyspora elongata]TDD48391.1 arylamine N-acetyltransferase [Saccharopolyspora elongata]
MSENEHDEWQIGTVDVDAYLDRLGHPRVEPSAAALRSLHEAHVRAIPFENIDVILGQHPGVALPDINDKLVRRGRGGYCYEHALLFAAVLENLGFDVERRMARTRPRQFGFRTHAMLRVRVDGTDHLADVGFGANLFTPMPFEDGALVDQAGWKHRLVREGALWTLEIETAEGWEALHSSDEMPQHFADYEVAHHFISTHPRSPFGRKLVVMRLDQGISRRLVGDELTVERPGGNAEVAKISVDQLEPVLRDLDVRLSDAEFDALRARHGSTADNEI